MTDDAEENIPKADAPKKRSSRHRGPDAFIIPRPKPRDERRGVFPREQLDAIILMIRGGATDYEISKAFAIPVDTLYNWRGRSYELAEALRLGKEGLDNRIERTLAARALGYTFESEDIKVIEGQIVRVPIVTHIPPDTTAMIFWLKNRKQWEWRERHEMAVSGDLNVTNDQMPDDRKLAMLTIALLREAALKAGKPAIEHKDETDARDEGAAGSDMAGRGDDDDAGEDGQGAARRTDAGHGSGEGRPARSLRRRFS